MAHAWPFIRMVPLSSPVAQDAVLFATRTDSIRSLQPSPYNVYMAKELKAVKAK
jgi:hypothetical protein